MREEILALCRTLGGKVDETLLDILCGVVCARLDGMLREGVTAEDCEEAYIAAAAWLVLDCLRVGQSWEGVTTLSAGDMTVRREPGGKSELEERALGLMRSWLRDDSFVFRGVMG